jgi:hypothetical protein
MDTIADYRIITKTSLRPDPDDSSKELISLGVGIVVSVLRTLGTWSKVSYTDGEGATFVGWVHSDALKKTQAHDFELFDAPYGQSRTVTGDLIEVLRELPPWQKISIRLNDGSAVTGWIDTSTSSGGGTGETGGTGQDGEVNLRLGPNEIYRVHLLEAMHITGIDAAALAALIDAEASKLPSGQWNANSAAPGSSAVGLTQFLEDTWIDQAKRSGTILNQEAKTKGDITTGNEVADGRRAALLDLRLDPRLSIVTAAEYGLFNLNGLIKADVIDDSVGDDDKARFIYIAHHEGLSGATGFLKGTTLYTFSDLVKQVGRSKAQQYVDIAGGDTTKAYHNWLNDYVDEHIQPSHFRGHGSNDSGGQGTLALSSFNGPPIAIAELGGEPKLVKAIQWRLSELGYLDPPADGVFGPVTTWALSEFCDLNRISLGDGFTKALAQRLLTPTALLPELAQTGTWFDKVIVYMKKMNYFICRHPDCKNIIYLEGVNTDGTLNDDIHNQFNDVRIVFSIAKSGKPEFANSIWDGTTEPGDYWTIHPMNPKGAARIAFNQYKAWVVGVHHPNKPQAHEALVQASPVSVYRDLNQDFKRPGDKLDTGMFAINQHWGYNAPKGDLGRTSAGCLVGRTTEGHRQFMTLVKNDPRYITNHSYKFVTAIMPGDKVII